MKKNRIFAVALSLALVLCMLLATACDSCKKDPGPTGTPGKTAFGNVTNTDTVKDPSDDVKIKLIRGKNVIKEGVGTLDYNAALNAGDIIEVEADRKYIAVDLFEALGEQIVYSPSGCFVFQVPSSSSRAVYPSGAFDGESHSFKAHTASAAELGQARNLAVNAYDWQYIDEKNDQTVATMSDKLLNSAAVSGGQVVSYPHAYANRVTRGEVGFYARNAIDGRTESDGHGNFPYQSWGYDQKSDAEFVVYFGREVQLSSVAFTLRADYAVSGGKEHDTYWESATIEFSDGTSESVTFEKSGEEQEFAVSAKTEFVRVKDLASKQDAGSQMYAALTELKANGKETGEENPAAEKKTITMTFGGKELGRFKTSEYSAEEIKATMDRANDWFINKTESENYQIPDYNGNPMQVKVNDAGWKDAVYYSGLYEAFAATGDMDYFYFLRSVGNQFKYQNNNGNHTPHGDNYQIGETYLMLNDLFETEYKTADTMANADFNLARDMNDKNPPNGSGLDKSRDWSHMGFWWCDSLYMALNTYTLLSIKTGEDKYVEAAYEGYKFWKKELYNEDYKLWWRDSTQKPLLTDSIDPDTGKKYPVFWSRGNAWVLAALAKQMEYLDPDRFPEIYEVYKNDFIELSESLLKYQREDGTWNASIVDENYFGGKETTGTCGFVYAYCVGMDLGILDSDEYFPAVSKAYDCVINECMIGDQVGYMQTTGYQPQNYKNEEYSKTNTHEFGMGLFLLASSGMMRICSDYGAATVVIPPDPQAALLG